MAKGSGTSLVQLDDLRGGRNGSDPPHKVPANQAIEMLNVDTYFAALGSKRFGCDDATYSGGLGLSGNITFLYRWVPAANELAAELWEFDATSLQMKRLAAGTSWANVNWLNTPTDGTTLVGCTFDGKLFLAGDSNVDRLQVYDPAESSLGVRSVGLSTPGVLALVANGGGAGAYAAVLRYYRARWVDKIGSAVHRLSEPGTSTGFTPSGANANATITQPSTFGLTEGMTHWRLEGSTDNITFYVLSDIAIGTTTYIDTAATGTYSSNPLSPAVGLYLTWSSVKYIISDGNRLIGGGNWETGTPANSRVYYSPVLGDTDQGDAERVVQTATQKNWVDLNENDGGYITGMGGPIFGVPYVFKYRQVWKLLPTGDVTSPYLPRKVSDTYGCIGHRTIVSAVDASGNPALYFLSPHGPCRIVLSGGSAVPQYIGQDIEDIWATVNVGVAQIYSHGVYHADKHQVWWWVSTSGSAVSDTKIVFDVEQGVTTQEDRVRGGWYKHTGLGAATSSSCMFSTTPGASMSRDLKPYTGGAAKILRHDTNAQDDAGTTFQAYIKTRPLPLAPLGLNVGVGQTHLLAEAATGVTITQTLDRDFGLETRTSTVSLTPAASETQVLRKFENSDLAQAGTVQIQLGDASAVSNHWELNALVIPVTVEEPR